MEIGELIAVIAAGTQGNEKDEPCDYQDPKHSTNWEARVGINSEGKALGTLIKGDKSKPSSTTLKKNLDKKLGPEARKRRQTRKEEDGYAYAAHHLIPKSFLPNHQVSAFLTKDYDTHPDYQLTGDTNYDVDNADNGLFLPMAYFTREWKKANRKYKKALQDIESEKKNQPSGFKTRAKGHELQERKRQAKNELEETRKKLTDAMMKKTGEQAHHGSHDACGYNAQVSILLDQLFTAVQDHASGCISCKKDQEETPVKIPPLAKMPEWMNVISSILAAMIQGPSPKVYVSQRAVEFFEV